MALNLENLARAIRKQNKKLDGISESLIKSIKAYQKEYEIMLKDIPFDMKEGKLKSTIGNYNRAQSLNPMAKLGFRTLAADHIKKYTPVARDAIAWNGKVGYDFNLKYNDITSISRLKNVDFKALFGESALVDAQIKQQLVNGIALQADYKDLVKGLKEQMLGGTKRQGMLARYADTYMRTSLNSFNRTIDQEIYDSIGGDKPDAAYLYAGPLDKRTRPFCAERVGLEYTREQVEDFSFQNGSGLDPFINPGGWNCRHKMMFIQ